jgi:hypothetical protein
LKYWSGPSREQISTAASLRIPHNDFSSPNIPLKLYKKLIR